MSAVTNNFSILDTLRNDHASWPRLVSFHPSTAEADSDTNLRNRYLALLALHEHHQAVPGDPMDEALVAYLLDQEIRYHQCTDHYRSSISLASYLLARYRKPAYIWAVWAARETNFDASISVDVHYLYYVAGGMENAKTFVEGCEVADVVGGTSVGSGIDGWWKWVVEEHGNEGDALHAVKTQVIERIGHDKEYGITDEKVEIFIEKSWRSQTTRWGESLLPLDY